MVPVGDMFQKKTDEIFSGMPNVFSIADDILMQVLMTMAETHNATLDKILRICKQNKPET